MKERGKFGIGVFVGVAVVEHLVFTVILALAVYTEPVRKRDNTPISVQILTDETEQMRIAAESPIAIPPLRRIDTPDELVPVHSESDVQRYLTSTQSPAGLPNLPAVRGPNQDPDRFSLAAAPSQGRQQDILDDLETTSAVVRSKPLTDETGVHGASARRGASDVGNQKKITSDRGYSTAENVSSGRTALPGPNRLSGGVQDGPIITGEVSGRGYRLGKPIRTEGKQGGSVQLTFKVRPDGSVYDVRVKPGPLTTIGEVRLKERARRHVERIRFDPLPKRAKQVDQSGKIFIDFTTQMNQ